MSACKDTTELSAVVGTTLDAASGVVATSLLPLLDHRAALIGTNKGSVLVCAPSVDNADTLQPIADVVLHCGPVHDMALSTQHLVATAGHDAVACVFPLHAAFAEGGPAQVRRLTGHTVPLVALRFLSDGTTLVTLAADGHVRIVDVVHGDVLGVIPTGFAATCLACSLDETLLFVGGRSLAAVDLYPAMRPTSVQTSTAAAGVWAATAPQGGAGAETSPLASAGVRLYQWAAPTTDASAAVTHVSQAPRGMIIAELSVDAEDGSLTAVFARCGGAATSVAVPSCGRARWSAEGGRTADTTQWDGSTATDPTEQPKQPKRQLSARTRAAEVSLRCRTKASARPPVKLTPSSSSASSASLSSSGVANTAAALWHGRWYTSPFELVGDARALPGIGRCAAPGDVSAVQRDVTAPLPFLSTGQYTRGEEVAMAEVECEALQRECDALVFKIRSVRAARA